MLGFFCALVTNNGKGDKGDFTQHEGDGSRKSACSKSVTVKPHAENEVHAIPGHDHALKGEHGTHSHAKSTPSASDAAMEEKEISQKGDERPGFLGVPVPEATPGVVGPHAAEDGADGEEEHADLQGAVEIVVQSRGGLSTEEGFSENDMADTEC